MHHWSHLLDYLTALLPPFTLIPSALYWTSAGLLLFNKCVTDTTYIREAQDFIAFLGRIVVKVKMKFSLCLTNHHARKTYSGSVGIAPRNLDFGTRWRWVVSFTLRPLYPQGKSPRYPLDKRLGGPQSRSGHSGEENNSQPPESNPRTNLYPSRYTDWAIAAVGRIVVANWRRISLQAKINLWHCINMKFSR
jgi:hypothetical protein